MSVSVYLLPYCSRVAVNPSQCVKTRRMMRTHQQYITSNLRAAIPEETFPVVKQKCVCSCSIHHSKTEAARIHRRRRHHSGCLLKWQTLTQLIASDMWFRLKTCVQKMEKTEVTRLLPGSILKVLCVSHARLTYSRIRCVSLALALALETSCAHETAQTNDIH